jgi:hypothetical protein
MFRSYVAAGLMALGVFTYSQYAGLSPFSGDQARPVAGQPGVHK